MRPFGIFCLIIILGIIQEQDPYTIEPEPESRKEQDEDFRRIRQEWIDPGSIRIKFDIVAISTQ
jgi:hypothetical protein